MYKIGKQGGKFSTQTRVPRFTYSEVLIALRTGECDTFSRPSTRLLAPTSFQRPVSDLDGVFTGTQGLASRGEGLRF